MQIARRVKDAAPYGVNDKSHFFSLGLRGIYSSLSL